MVLQLSIFASSLSVFVKALKVNIRANNIFNFLLNSDYKNESFHFYDSKQKNLKHDKQAVDDIRFNFK